MRASNDSALPPRAPTERIAAIAAFDDALLGLTDVLDERTIGALSGRQQQALARVADSGLRLLGLIDDLLGGGFDLDLSRVAIDELCRSSLVLVEDLAQQRDLSARLRIDGALATLRADRRRLRHALATLLRNAVRFTPRGGSIGLDVMHESGGHAIRFTVWDTGQGMTDHDLDRIVRRGRASDGGTGIAIVREIAALHGGGVEIDTEPGQGTRFSIVLPTGDRERAEEAPRESRRAPVRRRRVLLATRDDARTAALSSDLHAERFDVAVARDAQEALDRAWEHEPEVLLVDAGSAGVDHLAVLRAIRSTPLPTVATMPIVAFTDLALPGDREGCLAAGADTFLVGPVIVGRLSAMVDTLRPTPA